MWRGSAEDGCYGFASNVQRFCEARNIQTNGRLVYAMNGNLGYDIGVGTEMAGFVTRFKTSVLEKTGIKIEVRTDKDPYRIGLTKSIRTDSALKTVQVLRMIALYEANKIKESV